LPIRKFRAVAVVVMVFFPPLSPAKTKEHTLLTPLFQSYSKPGIPRRSITIRQGQDAEPGSANGQQGIQSDRVLASSRRSFGKSTWNGAPTGKWDDRTQHAMAKYHPITMAVQVTPTPAR